MTTTPSQFELSQQQYVSKEKVHLRAVALQILGEAYMGVGKESGSKEGGLSLKKDEELGEGYVRVDVGGGRA